MTDVNALTRRGYDFADFGLSAEQRANYARLGNHLMELASEDATVREALTFNIFKRNDDRGNQAGMFGMYGALHSADEKLWLHAGYQTAAQVEARLPKTKQPQLLQEFLEEHQELLAAIEASYTAALRDIDASKVAELILPSDVMQRAIHVRVVRYIGARAATSVAEPVSGHADMGLCTLHLYETHGNWFHAAPFPADLISDDDSPEHQAKIRAMRSELELIDEANERAVFFLGAGWKHLTVEHPDVPACYHAGIRPEPAKELVSPYASDVLTAPHDRVSLVVFAQPNVAMVNNGSAVFPSVTECRPEY